jgi:predicted transcriptional regulator
MKRNRDEKKVGEKSEKEREIHVHIRIYCWYGGDNVDIDKIFMEEFGHLSRDIQGNEIQGKIQMFFRLIKPKVTQDELAEIFDVKNSDIDAAMENFRILGVAEETEENGLIVYIFRGYSSEIRDIVNLFPDRKERLEKAVETLEQVIEKAEQQGKNVDKYVAVLNDVKNDFGIP